MNMFLKRENKREERMNRRMMEEEEVPECVFARAFEGENQGDWM